MCVCVCEEKPKERLSTISSHGVYILQDLVYREIPSQKVFLFHSEIHADGSHAIREEKGAPSVSQRKRKVAADVSFAKFDSPSPPRQENRHRSAVKCRAQVAGGGREDEREGGDRLFTRLFVVAATVDNIRDDERGKLRRGVAQHISDVQRDQPLGSRRQASWKE